MGNLGNEMSDPRKIVLHAGCGRAVLPEVRFPAAAWREIRLDIDAGHRPDVVGSLILGPRGRRRDESDVEPASFTA